MSHTSDIAIFTDGACSGNPGPGGWAAIIYVKAQGKVIEIGGGDSSTTNNRMELTAAIRALEMAKHESGKILVHSDSKYVIDGITQWVFAWKKRGWRKADKKEVLNRDLWEHLDGLANFFKGRLKWQYVPGHSGHPANDRCDRIAVAFSKNAGIELYEGPKSGYRIAL